MVARVRRSRPSSESPVEVPAKIHVAVSVVKGVSEKDEERIIAVRRFETEPAYVRCSAGVTKSTGNYESLRVDVAVTMPCYAEEVERTYTEVSDFVASKLEEEIDAYLGEQA